jgi:hypothetical protein
MYDADPPGGFMTDSFTIEEFWQPMFHSVQRVASPNFPAGWSSPQPSQWFIEPDLTLRPDWGSPKAPILLIAAPGAVGKSTLARNVCARTGMLLVDLAKSDTVGGNFLTGGLMKAGSQVLAACANRTLGLAIDALDEARLRVTQPSFDDFLKDVADVTRQCVTPVVLFGRTGIVDECWLWFHENGHEVALLDIELFDEPRAVRFIENDLRRRAHKQRELGQHTSFIDHIESFAEPYRKAALGFVRQLADTGRRNATAQTALEFSGYAPVLEAVGAMLADTLNPASIAAGGLQTRSRDVLFQVVDHILDREQEKLRTNLPSTFGSPLPVTLYDRDEQRQRLAARLFKLRPPPTPQQVPQSLQQTYEEAVDGFLAQHPFLDGTGTTVSSAVFGAELIAFALHSSAPELRVAGETWAERSNNGTPNPFLIDFYENHSPAAEQNPIFVAPEHVGLLDASMRARLRAGQHATFEFLQGEGDAASVTLQIVRSHDGVDETVEERTFQSSVAGRLRLMHKISRVTILAEDLDLELGDGQTCELAAPILVEVCNLRLRAKDVVISREASHVSHTSTQIDAVALFPKQADTSNVTKPPRVAEGISLRVQWPGATAHPWNRFVASPQTSDDPLLAEAQRALRRLVVSFRSHSKGQLARFRDKIESQRMTKGEVGERIREALLADHVLSIQGVYYILEPNELGAQLGTDYSSLLDKVFSERANAYLTKLLPKAPA